MTTLSYSDTFDFERMIAVPIEKAAALANMPKWRLHYWDITEHVKAGIRRRMSVGRLVRLYTMPDLVGLIVTAELRRRKISLQHIRSIVKYLRATYAYKKPLAELTFAVHNGEVYIQHPDGSWEGDQAPGQLVIKQVIPLDEIRDHILSHLHRPSDLGGQTDRRRGRVGNKETFAGTRIPVATVQRWLEHGAGTDKILEAYPDLTPADVELARSQLAVGA